MFTHYMPPHMGGIELVAERLVRVYESAGLTVEWIASRVPASEPEREPGRVRLRSFNGLERFSVPWPLWTPAACRTVLKVVKWADVVHVHDCIYVSSAVATLCARRTGKPVLLTQHKGWTPYPQRWLNAIQVAAYATLGKAVLKRASHLAVAGPSAAALVNDLLRSRSPPRTRIDNGVDINRFRPPAADERRAARAALGLPQDRPVVLFAGRLVALKGVELVAAVAHRRAHRYHFLIVGGGPMAHLLPRGPSVSWIERVPPSEIHHVYRAADALLLPARGEGLPLVVQEAMASGVPPVVLEDELFAQELRARNVCITAAPSPEALCSALDTIFSRADFAAALALRARQFAVRRWSLERMSSEYLKLVAQLLQPARAAGRHSHQDLYPGHVR
ncbi:MAG TPA: glycosyltransferase family 4 protein [Gemmatimonadales bacterium]|nr:glycosyltransferase family 4 protein [Gemmatimonadales bacterium]